MMAKIVTREREGSGGQNSQQQRDCGNEEVTLTTRIFIRL